MDKHRRVAGVMACMLMAACAGQPAETPQAQGPGVGGKADDPVGPMISDHDWAQRQCLEARNAAVGPGVDPSTYPSVIDQFTECVAAANDAAVSIVEEDLKAQQSPDVDTTQLRFDGLRGASEALCELLTDASPRLGGLVNPLFGPTCRSSFEEALATLIDAHVDLGPGTEKLWIGQHPSFDHCYADYQQKAEALGAGQAAAPGEEVDDPAKLAAMLSMIECVNAAFRRMSLEAYARALWPEEDAETRSEAFGTALDAVIDAAGEVCTNLGQAAGLDALDNRNTGLLCRARAPIFYLSIAETVAP